MGDNKRQFRIGTWEEHVWHGKPAAPTINYFGRPGPDVAPEARGGEGHEND